MITFTFGRGEPIAFGYTVTSGDPADFGFSAELKPAADFTVPDHDVASVADFETELTEATDSEPAALKLWIDAATADALPRGRYVTDVAFTLDGEPVQVSKPPIFLNLIETVSG